MKVKPIGVFLLSIFLLLAIIVLGVSAISLLIPGTFLDKMWDINPKGYAEMQNYRSWVGYGFLALAIFFIFAWMGWVKRKKWGWWMTLCIFLLNGAGDVVRLIKGDYFGGILGIVIAGLIIYYLTRPRVKNLFEK